MMKDKNIDNLFREKLLDYEKQPPAYLLENVLAKVGGARRRRRIAFWRVAGVAAALLLAFVAGWQVNYMNQEIIKQPIVVNQDSSVQTKEEMNAARERKAGLNKIQKAKVAVVKSSGSNGSVKGPQVASRIAHLDDNIKSQPITTSSNEKYAVLQPLKTITHQIDINGQSGSIINEKKVNNSVIDQPERTIDEQIIEQNQQQLRVQNKTRKNGHWLVGAQVSPAYSVKRGNHSSEYASNMLNASSNIPVNLGGGLSVEYKPGKRWSLQSGVYYAGLGQSSVNSFSSNRSLSAVADKGSEYFNAPVNIEASKMMINSTAGVIEMSGIPSEIEVGNNLEDKTMASAVVVSDARFIQNFKYIEIPLYLRYSLIDARFDVELMGGISSNVLVGNEAYMESSAGNNLVGKTQNMQGMNYSGTFGFGLKYGLSNRLFLNVEPRIKYYLNSLNSNSAVTYKPYTIGVYTGISYQF